MRSGNFKIRKLPHVLINLPLSRSIRLPELSWSIFPTSHSSYICYRSKLFLGYYIFMVDFFMFVANYLDNWIQFLLYLLLCSEWPGDQSWLLCKAYQCSDTEYCCVSPNGCDQLLHQGEFIYRHILLLS